MKSVLTLCALLAALMLASCARSTATPGGTAGGIAVATRAPTPTAIANDLRGYLASDADSAIFVEWTDAGGTLAGTLHEAGPDPQHPSAVKTQSAGFTGLRAGNRVTLTIPAGFGFSTALSGTIAGDTLTLFITDDRGITTPTTLHVGTLTDYNRAVTALEQGAAAQATEAIATAPTSGLTACSVLKSPDSGAIVTVRGPGANEGCSWFIERGYVNVGAYADTGRTREQVCRYQFGQLVYIVTDYGMLFDGTDICNYLKAQPHNP